MLANAAHFLFDKSNGYSWFIFLTFSSHFTSCWIIWRDCCEFYWPMAILYSIKNKSSQWNYRKKSVAISWILLSIVRKSSVKINNNMAKIDHRAFCYSINIIKSSWGNEGPSRNWFFRKIPSIVCLKIYGCRYAREWRCNIQDNGNVWSGK